MKILSHGHQIVAVRGHRQAEHLSLYSTLLFQLTLQPACGSVFPQQGAISQYDINTEFTTDYTIDFSTKSIIRSLEATRSALHNYYLNIEMFVNLQHITR